MSENDKLAGAQADPVRLKMYCDLFDKESKVPLIGVREFTIDQLFAKIWSRSREPIDKERMISLREQSMITVALLAAQGHDDELRSHIRGARHQGIAQEQILEIMIHVSHYAGWAADNSGQRRALEVFQRGGSGLRCNLNSASQDRGSNTWSKQTSMKDDLFGSMPEWLFGLRMPR